jgi:Fic family protein
MSGTLDRTYSGTEDRPYAKTHPWINFRLDLQRASFRFWLDLGAVQSKIEHVANALLFPKTAQQFRVLYLAKGVHATTAIEGNTLSEEQVRDRIEGKAKLPESKAYLGQEIDNIVEACNQIAPDVLSGQRSDVTPDQIMAFNEMVLRGLPLDEHVVPGQFRKHSVGVAGYRGAPWEDCQYLVDRLSQWLNSEFRPPSDELAIGFAVLKAVVAHLYIAWIHPFGDGNGRTARLVEFQILLSGGAPDVAAHLLSNFYNQTRTEYYRQLQVASQSPDGATRFLSYAVRGLRDALDEQIEVIRKDLRQVVWRDYVSWSFRQLRGDAADRRRLLALELAGAKPSGVPVSKLSVLNAEIAKRYANKTAKTLSRDVNELEKLDLVLRRGREIQANIAIFSRFQPKRHRAARGEPTEGEDQESDSEIPES